MELHRQRKSTRKSKKPLELFSCTMNCFKELPFVDDQELVVILSRLWNIAANRPDDPELPSLGVFQCMAQLIDRGITDPNWLLRAQNIYVPYYGAHIIGSYTMNRAQFAETAVKSGVVQPLMELLRGKMSWVEQRAAVRAFGHLATHETTFEAVAIHEIEIVNLAMKIASTCYDTVFTEFIDVNGNERLKYHCSLMTRGIGGLDMENRKAEEWAGQLQRWSLYLLNCFVCKGRSVKLICRQEFLNELSGMWAGNSVENQTLFCGINLIRSLCNREDGRKAIANSERSIKSLCNLSRCSGDFQYMAIESLLCTLKDPNTRHVVIDIAVVSLADLVEIRSIRGREKVGDTITQILLKDYGRIKYGQLGLKNKRTQKKLEEIWELKVERRKREEMMSEEAVKETEAQVGSLKREGNQKFWSGSIEEAMIKYTKALDLCTLRMEKQRIVLYSNRAQCHLLLRRAEHAITDATRALCLSGEASPHVKSLWRRSQAYDMKGMERESLMDCLMFTRGPTMIMKSEGSRRRRVKIPDYAARMLSKQMNATWVFAAANTKKTTHGCEEETVLQSRRKRHERRSSKHERTAEKNGLKKYGL